MSAPDKKNPFGADFTPAAVRELYEKCHTFYQKFMENVGIPYSVWTPEDIQHVVDQTFDDFDGVNLTFMDAILYSMAHVGGISGKNPRIEYIPFSVVVLLQMFAFRDAFPREFLDNVALSDSEGVRDCIRYFYGTIFNTVGQDFIFKFGYATHTRSVKGRHAMAILGRYDYESNNMRLIIFDPHGRVEYNNIMPVAEFISLIAYNAPTSNGPISLGTLNSQAGYQGQAGVCSWITHDLITTILLRTTYEQRTAWFASCTTLCTDPFSSDPPGIQYINASCADARKEDSSSFTNFFRVWYEELRGPHPTDAEYPVRHRLLQEIRTFFESRIQYRPENRHLLKDSLPKPKPYIRPRPIAKLTEIENKDLEHMFYVASLLENIVNQVELEKPDAVRHSAPTDRRILKLGGIILPRPLAVLIRSFISYIDNKELPKARRILFHHILPNLKDIRITYSPGQDVVSINQLEKEEEEKEKRKKEVEAEEKRRKEIELEQRQVEMRGMMQRREEEKKREAEKKRLEEKKKRSERYKQKKQEKEEAEEEAREVDRYMKQLEADLKKYQAQLKKQRKN